MEQKELQNKVKELIATWKSDKQAFIEDVVSKSDIIFLMEDFNEFARDYTPLELVELGATNPFDVDDEYFLPHTFFGFTTTSHENLFKEWLPFVEKTAEAYVLKTNK